VQGRHRADGPRAGLVDEAQQRKDKRRRDRALSKGIWAIPFIFFGCMYKEANPKPVLVEDAALQWGIQQKSLLG
jgi:hypothetical protein